MPENRKIFSEKFLNELDTTLVSAFLRAYKNKHEAVWNELMDFLSVELLAALADSSIPLVRHLSSVPARFLQCSLDQEYGSERIIDHFGRNFDFFEKFLSSEVASEEDDTAVLNRLLYQIIASFYYQVLRVSSDALLERSFEHFNKLAYPGFDFRSELRKAKFNGATPEELDRVRADSELIGFRPLLKRRLALSLHSWSLFLSSMDKMDFMRAKKVIKGLELRYTKPQEILIDAVYIRKHSNAGFLGIQWWDFMERKSGTSYSPPSPYHWITLGATYHLLNSPLADFDFSEVPGNNDYIFLLEKVKENIAFFEHNWDRWSKFFESNADGGEEEKSRVKENFLSNGRMLLSILARLKNRQQYIKDKEVADEYLSGEKVEKFKKLAGDDWKRNNRMLTIFDFFGNVTKHEQMDGLPAIGSSHLLQGLKIMFVDQNYQEVHGSGHIGGEAARIVDGRFIQEIQFGQMETTYPTLEEGLRDSFLSLEIAEFEPTLIIIPPEFIYRTDLYAMAGFTSNDQGEGVADFGSYRGIPITTLYTTMLSEDVYVLDFASAMQLEIYEDAKRIDGRLNLEIRSLTDSQIDDMFEKDADGWRNKDGNVGLTDQEIKTKIATSVYVDIWVNARFNIKDITAMRKFKIKQLGPI